MIEAGTDQQEISQYTLTEDGISEWWRGALLRPHGRSEGRVKLGETTMPEWAAICWRIPKTS